MNVQVLLKALDYYVRSTECSIDEVDLVAKAKGDCTEIIELYENDNNDLWKGSIQFVTTPVLSDLLNLATYDTYGKAKRELGDDMTFERYCQDCREPFGGYPSLTNENLDCGYSIIADLWQDNEDEGDNNADGTFKSK